MHTTFSQIQLLLLSHVLCIYVNIYVCINRIKSVLYCKISFRYNFLHLVLYLIISLGQHLLKWLHSIPSHGYENIFDLFLVIDTFSNFHCYKRYLDKHLCLKLFIIISSGLDS